MHVEPSTKELVRPWEPANPIKRASGPEPSLQIQPRYSKRSDSLLVIIPLVTASRVRSPLLSWLGRWGRLFVGRRTTSPLVSRRSQRRRGRRWPIPFGSCKHRRPTQSRRKKRKRKGEGVYVRAWGWWACVFVGGGLRGRMDERAQLAAPDRSWASSDRLEPLFYCRHHSCQREKHTSKELFDTPTRTTS